MENSSNETTGIKWLESAIEDKLINFFDYDEFNGKEKINVNGDNFVYKSEWTKCGLTVVLKSLKFDTEGKDLNLFIKEIQLLQRVSFHPKINHFYGIVKDPFENYMMVLQYANEGDLREYLNKNFSKLEWADKYRIAGEIAQGLLFLHNNKIIHRNLHPKNILVHENKIMISDFGLSKSITPDSSSNSVIDGMPAFMDPQCFKNPKYKRTTKTDIYSYGVVLWEISSGHKPFQSLKRIQIAIKIYNGEREKLIEGTPPKYVELYKQCWDDEPNNRPQIEEIIDFFNPYIIKSMDTNVNIESPSEGLLEEAISNGNITFYDYDQFSDHIKIAEEEFSSVCKSEWKSQKLTVALKCLKVNHKYLDKRIIKELQFLQKNKDHPNIIQFYGMTKDPCNEYYSAVLQFADGGNLHDYLIKNPNLQWAKKFSMAIEIAEGLKYLHENSIAHLDLNSKNIWVCNEKMLIVGFGNVSFSASITQGMPAYTEPQCLKEPSYQRDIKSDIYSFGVVLWEISSGKIPFNSFENGYAIAIHVFNRKRETPVEGTPPEYEKLYKLCWDEDPGKRPNIESVLEKLKELQQLHKY